MISSALELLSPFWAVVKSGKQITEIENDNLKKNAFFINREKKSMHLNAGKNVGLDFT